jgi:4-hydroxybenzoate polyprenyltransferase
LGRKNALRLSTVLHLLCAGLIIGAAYLLQQDYQVFSALLWIASGIFIALLFYQHTLVKPQDLSKVNIAFFTTNGMASLIFGVLVIVDIFL